MNNSDEYYMKEALKEAKKAYQNGDVPVGAIIVINDKIVSRGYNQKEKKKNALLHAEVIAINKALKKLDIKILDNATIYTTLEPCLMCMGAIINSRIKRIVVGTLDQRFGMITNKVNLFDLNLNHYPKIDVLNNIDCSNILSNFFKDLREKKSLEKEI